MLLLVLACRPAVEPAASVPVSPPDDTAPAPLSCPTFGPGQALGEVQSAELTEASGLVFHDGVLWTHNDSGAAALFALHPDGATRSRIPLEGVSAVIDWEDLALAGDQLVIGDVGDNLAARASVGLIEVPLPDPDADGVPVPARQVVTVWPTGATDAETLLFDPVTGDLVVVSKAFDGLSVLARAPSPLDDGVVLEEVARLQFGQDALGTTTLVTGGATAPDGTGVVLRTYLDAFAWPRIAGEPWADTFARPPCFVDLQTEPQGEAIAWGDEGLYTVSEGTNPTIWHYPASSTVE